MIRWLYIDSDPPLQIHDAAAVPYIDPAVRAEQILASVGTIRSDVDGEVPNITFALYNRDGETSEALADPPLGERAVLYGRFGNANVVQMVGVIESVELNDDGATMEMRA